MTNVSQKILQHTAITIFLIFFFIGLSGLQVSQIQAINTTVNPPTALCDITGDLERGMFGSDVKELQRYLNSNGFPLARTGFGSKGKETTYFGPLTKNALVKFQQDNKISATIGVFDLTTRDFIGCAKPVTVPLPAGFQLTRDLKRGMFGSDVKELQRYLNNNGFPLARTGFGSKGKETTFFDPLTKAALMKFQKAKQLTSESGKLLIDTRNNINGIQQSVAISESVTVPKVETVPTPTYVEPESEEVPVDQPEAVAAPSSLSYTTPNLFLANTAISTLFPSVSGTVASYSISPALPTGLSLNTSNGQITGTPTESTSSTTYTITATNAGGSTTFNSLVIMVDGTVTSASGRVWLDRNIGATQIALSSSDSAAYGSLFQWGRPADGHQILTSDTQSGQVATITPGTNTFIIPSGDWSNIDNNGALRSAYFAKTDGTGICPTGFRVPTDAELVVEMNSWSSQNIAGAFASPLKLAGAGFRKGGDATFDRVGSYGYYWSSSANGTNANYMVFSDITSLNPNTRAYGFSVRCIKEIATAPSSVTLAVGSSAPVGGVTNVTIPAAGDTDTTGAVTGWEATSADKMKFTVVNGGSATSTITIGGAAYTSGADYTVPSASPLTIIVTTTEAGKTTATRTFTISVAAAEEAPTVGMAYQGGKVAYIFQAGDTGYVAGQTHGLIIATANQSSGIVWAKPANQSTSVPGGTLATIGSGSANTDKIIAQNGLDSTYAAGIARSYAGGGYGDWYLPSRNELTQVFNNRALIGGLDSAYYWSSTEVESFSGNSWSIHLAVGSNGNQLKSVNWSYVRATRSF